MLMCYALVYSAVIGILYHAVSTIFNEVQGYVYSVTTAWLLFLSCVLSILPVLYLPLHSTRVSSSILWVVFYVFYVPSVVISQYILGYSGIDATNWMILLFLGFSLSISGHYFHVYKFPKLNISYRGYFLFLCFFWIIFIVVLYKNFGLSFNFSSLKDVYGHRAEFKSELSSSGSAIAGYVIILSGYWLAPAMLLSGVYYARSHLRYGWWLICMGMMLSAYVYSIAAFKSIALSFVLVFCYARLMRVNGLVGAKIFFGIMAVVGASWAIASISGYSFVAHQLVRRAILSPGMNAAYYFDYFRKPGDIMNLLPAEIISRYYYGTDGNANAGYLAAGFALLGTWGVVVTGVTMACALWLANMLTRGVPFILLAAGFFMQSYALSNSGFGTVMISYGFIFAALTFYLCPFRDASIKV